MNVDIKELINRLNTYNAGVDVMDYQHDGTGLYVLKSDVIELVENLTKWNKVEDFPNDDNIFVVVRTKHKLVDDYDGYDLANYAHGKYWLSSENLIPIEWKYI